jgi:hypothetical protein
MPARVRVPARVASRCGVAAADVAAGQAQTQMDPGRAELQALLAALGRARHDRPDEAEMRSAVAGSLRRLREGACEPDQQGAGEDQVDAHDQADRPTGRLGQLERYEQAEEER